MAIRDWPASEIKRLWRIGLTVEAGLMVLAIAASAIGNAYERRQARPAPLPQAFRREALTPHQRDSLTRAARARLDSAGVRLTANGDTSTFAFNDSTTASFVVSNDSIHIIALSPAARHVVANVIEPPLRTLAQVIRALIWRVLLFLGIVFLPIPLTLAGITVYWRGPRLHTEPSA